MGIKDVFRFFKGEKKTPAETTPNETARQTESSPVTSSEANDISRERRDYICTKFRYYIHHFENLQAGGDYAPIAAVEKTDGNMHATAFLSQDSNTQVNIENVIDNWKEKFTKQIGSGEIISFIILYHIHMADDGKEFEITRDAALANAVALYCMDKVAGIEGTIFLPHKKTA